MRLEDLMDELEICGPEEFDSFEHLAGLLETPEYVEYEDFCYVLGRVSFGDLSEILEQYFEDILLGVSDEAVDFYTLLSTAGQAIAGMAKGTGDEEQRRALLNELYRFREWYTEPDRVTCENKADGSGQSLSVFEALVQYRTEKLLGKTFEYDYTDALDYKVEEYVMSYALDGQEAGNDLNSGESEDDGDCDCGCHHHDHRHHHDDGCQCGHCDDDDPEDDDFGQSFDPYRDGLVDRQAPVIDGEFTEDNSNH